MDAELVPTVAIGRLAVGNITECIASLMDEAIPTPDCLERLVRPGTRVMIIADFGHSETCPEQTVYLKVLDELVRCLVATGAAVSVGDATAVPGLKTGAVYRRLGLPEAAIRAGFSLTNFELSQLDLRLVESRLYMIPRPVLEADVVINLARGSFSPQFGVRGALVNLAGAVPGMRLRLAQLERACPRQAGERLADILSLVSPALNLVLCGTSSDRRDLMVSVDAVAADVVTAACFGVAGPDLPLVRIAAGSGLGIGHIEAIKCMGDNIITDTNRSRLKAGTAVQKPSRWRPVRRVHPRIDPDLCTDCGVCETTCPARAIQTRPGEQKPSIDRRRCQACLCCHEVCPSGAISYRSVRQPG